jgi:spermidine synthase
VISLSHLGREIHRRYDEFGPILVFDDGNKRYLSFGTADEQSCQLKSAPLQLQHEYARAMIAVLMQSDASTPPANITLLGTGGGTLASTLFHWLPQATIQTVDLRQAVFQIAQQYFALPRDKRLSTHVSDAAEFLRNSEQGQCDLLICDLYLADGLDPLVLQSDFLDLCERHLSAHGWLVLNLWKEHREQTDCLAQLKQRFPQLLQSTTTDGNWILWASKYAEIADKKTARERCVQRSPLAGFNLWSVVKGFYRHR